MIAYNELSNYKLLLAVKEYTEKISSGYSLVDGFTDYILRCVKKVQSTAEELVSDVNTGGGNFAPARKWTENESENAEMLQTLEQFKVHIRADDWLFLKALLTENKNDGASLIGLAHVISPENAYFFLISKGLTDDIPSEAFLQMATNFNIKRNDKALWEYYNILKITNYLHYHYFDPASFKVLRFVENSGFTDVGRFYLLLNLVNKTFPPMVLDLIHRLKTKKKSEAGFFSLLEGIINYRLKSFEAAAKKLQSTDIEALPIAYNEKYEYTAMLANSYMFIGNEGQAILCWKSILNDNEIMDMECMAYYEAIINVSAYYLRINRVQEAKQILSGGLDFVWPKLPAETVSSYYSLKGDVHYAEGEFVGALKNYRKAFGIHPSFILNSKIQWLEQMK
jgi:tetratricopeptide (TPR) repeat protein